jgi:Calcineurin-like phosphoesterase
VKLGVVSDVHWPRDPSKPAAWHNVYEFAGLSGRLGAAVECFDAAPADAVLVLGDLAHDGDAGSLHEVLSALRAAEAPLWALPGNHDCEERDDQLVRVAAGAVGLLDRTSWAHGAVHITGVAIASDPERGGMRADCALQLAPRGLVVVASHFPMISRAAALAERKLAYAGDLLDRSRIHRELVASVAPVVLLSGHLHARDSATDAGVLQLSAAALVEAPYEVAVVEILESEAGWTVERTCTSLGDVGALALPVLTPAFERWVWSAGTWTAGAP